MIKRLAWAALYQNVLEGTREHAVAAEGGGGASLPTDANAGSLDKTRTAMTK